MKGIQRKTFIRNFRWVKDRNMLFYHKLDNAFSDQRMPTAINVPN